MPTYLGNLNGPMGYTGPPGNPGPVVPLDELTDVAAPTPSEGDQLRYVDGQWINCTPRLTEACDADDTQPADGDVLVWRGGADGKWIREQAKAGADGKDGADGQNGNDGNRGPKGDRGTLWFYGSGAPSEPLTKASTGETSRTGDLYLDTDSGDVYELAG